MNVKEVKIGLQIHSVREAFAENPWETLQKIREIGYTGIELAMPEITLENKETLIETAETYKKAMEEIGLECYGVLIPWKNVQPDMLEQTIQYNQVLGSSFLVIGSVPTVFVETKEEITEVITYMQKLQKILETKGIVTGYHNHDSDFFHVIEGKTFFEHIFDAMPEDFVMLLDTGNALAAGYDTIPLLNKYPGRSSYLHIKGYSKEKGYLAYIGEDDFDWLAVIECAMKTGKARVFDIEFGQRGDYEPFERAQKGYEVVSGILQKVVMEEKR